MMLMADANHKHPWGKPLHRYETKKMFPELRKLFDFPHAKVYLRVVQISYIIYLNMDPSEEVSRSRFGGYSREN